MLEVNPPHKGACHCGAIRFEVKLADGLKKPKRCTYSLCRMRGAVIVAVDVNDIVITQGADKISLYEFGTHTAKHYFCSVCGIYTHSRRRVDPTQYAVNVACLEGISPFDFPEVSVIDGVNHPKDQSEDSIFREVGVLRFIQSV